MITQADIIYFILTDRFCKDRISVSFNVPPEDMDVYHGGNFAGIISKIPYLKDLGITALWITPVYLSIGHIGNADGYHGYWAMDFEKVDPHLYTVDAGIAEGNKAYLRKLADVLHENGIKLILDMVINHTGYHNPAYSTYPDKKIQKNWFRHGNKDKELLGLPQLNHTLPDVNDYLVNNMVDWIEEAAIDGIRLDTVKHIGRPFWDFFKSYVRGKYRDITIIGEVLYENVNDVEKIAPYQSNCDIDMLFDFPLRTEIIRTLVEGESMVRLSRKRFNDKVEGGILDKNMEGYCNANRLVTLLDNHDLPPRIKTQILQSSHGYSRSEAVKVLKLCLSFQFTTRGVPQIYYGTEIGMEGDNSQLIRKDMRWEVFDKTYLMSHPDDAEAGEAGDIFGHTQKLVAIRKENEALSFGYLFTLYSDHLWYAYLREYRGNTLVVIINNRRGSMQNSLVLHIGDNFNIPIRIKNNLKERKRLHNQLNPSDSVSYENGVLEVIAGAKEAKIYRLS